MIITLLGIHYTFCSKTLTKLLKNITMCPSHYFRNTLRNQEPPRLVVFLMACVNVPTELAIESARPARLATSCWAARGRDASLTTRKKAKYLVGCTKDNFLHGCTYLWCAIHHQTWVLTYALLLRVPNYLPIVGTYVCKLSCRGGRLNGTAQCFRCFPFPSRQYTMIW